MRFALRIREIAAQRPDSSFGDGRGRSFKERSLRIAAGAMYQDKAVTLAFMRSMQKSADAIGGIWHYFVL